DHAGECILLDPYFDVVIGIEPQAFAVEPGGIFERLLDAVMRPRLAHPARGVGYIAVAEAPFAAEISDLALDLGVVVVVLADAGKGGDFGLIIEATDRYRSMFAGIGDQELGALPHLSLGGPSTFYGAIAS